MPLAVPEPQFLGHGIGGQALDELDDSGIGMGQTVGDVDLNSH